VSRNPLSFHPRAQLALDLLHALHGAFEAERAAHLLRFAGAERRGDHSPTPFRERLKRTARRSSPASPPLNPAATIAIRSSCSWKSGTPRVRARIGSSDGCG